MTCLTTGPPSCGRPRGWRRWRIWTMGLYSGCGADKDRGGARRSLSTGGRRDIVPPMKIAALTARCHLDRFTLLLIGLSMLGAALVLARTATYGVALEADQVNYIGVARSLLAGDGFSNVLVDEGYYTWRPPLYPILLAAASFGIFDPYAVAAPLNAVIFGLTVFVIGQYFRQHLASQFLLWWACLAVVASIPLTWLASHALSGALLVLMATLALTQAHKYLDEGKTSTLLWAAVFAAMAWQPAISEYPSPATVGLLLLFQTGATIPQKRPAHRRLLANSSRPDGDMVATKLPTNRRIYRRPEAR